MQPIRTAASSVATLLLAAAPLAAASQLVEVRVVDSESLPLGGIAVEIAGTEDEPWLGKQTTSALGIASFELPSAKRAYRLTIVHPDYTRFEQTFDLGAKGVARGDVVRLGVTLSPPDAFEHFNRGVMALQGGDLTAAEVEFRRAVELEPSFGRGWAVLALTAFELDRPADALEAAEHAIAASPEEADALRVRYEALVALGRADEADAALDSLLARDTSPALARTLFNAGAIAANADQPERARRRFAQSLQRNPELWQAHAALAELEIRGQRLDDALAEIDRALAIAPDERRLLSRKLDLLRALGRADDAAEVEGRLAALDAEG